MGCIRTWPNIWRIPNSFKNFVWETPVQFYYATMPQRLVRVITSMKNKDEFGGNLRWKYSPKPKCYKCGTLGHYANKCPNPTNPREQTSFSRVKKAHMSPKEMIKNYKCALCGKKGHRETQCPESRAFGDTYNAEKSSSSKEVNCNYSSS